MSATDPQTTIGFDPYHYLIRIGCVLGDHLVEPGYTLDPFRETPGPQPVPPSSSRYTSW